MWHITSPPHFRCIVVIDIEKANMHWSCIVYIHFLTFADAAITFHIRNSNAFFSDLMRLEQKTVDIDRRLRSDLAKSTTYLCQFAEKWAFRKNCTIKIRPTFDCYIKYGSLVGFLLLNQHKMCSHSQWLNARHISWHSNHIDISLAVAYYWRWFNPKILLSFYLFPPILEVPTTSWILLQAWIC